jgi:pyridine nucleotide-disulfide oxidoreductase family protein
MKRLVLLGGGHAHLHVLHDLARQPLPGTDAVLVTPYPQLVYSAMVPGTVAGHYAPGQAAIDLEPLAHAARMPLRLTHAVGLDAQARMVRLADGTELAYDWLSIATGASIDRDRIPGAREHALFVRPMERFVELWSQVVELARDRVLRVTVIGGGPGGVELAMAIKWRLRERVHVSLVTGGGPPLSGYPVVAQARATRALMRLDVGVLMEACTGIEAGTVLLANGARLACDAPVVATGPAPPPWLVDSGLRLKDGFVATDATLRSASHPAVFAAGDAASRLDDDYPKSGVYAVRAGVPLARNLRLAVGGQDPLPYAPPVYTLNLVSCGRRSAIASYGGQSMEGRWAWLWKDWIDRRFVARQRPRPRA